MLQAIWGGMMLLSIVYALATGAAPALLPGALAGAQDAVSLTVKLLAGYLFFCGIIEIVNALNAPRYISRSLSPLIRFLFPSIRRQETKDAIVMNFSANLLGLGNAATPMGIRAMERMDEERVLDATVLGSMYMFLVINAASLQIIPTTIISLRIAADSASPTAILLPTILCTAVSMVISVGAAILCANIWRPGHGKH